METARHQLRHHLSISTDTHDQVLIEHWADATDRWVDRCIQDARAGNWFEHEVCLEAAATRLLNGESLSPALADFVVDVLNRVVPLQIGYPRKRKNHRRDLAIYYAVTAVADLHGLPPTRNDALAAPEEGGAWTACDVVAAVSPEFSIALKYSGVYNVWSNWAAWFKKPADAEQLATNLALLEADLLEEEQRQLADELMEHDWMA
jgi:hypothetical protein